MCDRYKDSTRAYQAGGRALNPTFIQSLNNLTELEPDITLLYDCRIEVGLQRAKERAKLDRFEDEEYEFHHRIYTQYHELAKQEPNRFEIINANDSIENVFDFFCHYIAYRKIKQ